MSEAAADARRFGAPALADRLGQAAAGERGFGVWRQNWDIVLAFLSVSTQWRVSALASGSVYWVGLDYAGATAGLGAAGVAVTPQLWAGVRTMERAARDALNGVRG